MKVLLDFLSFFLFNQKQILRRETFNLIFLEKETNFFVNNMHKVLLLLACVLYTATAMRVGGKSTYDISKPENLQKVNELIEFGLSKLAEQRMKERLAAAGGNKKLEDMPPLKYAAVSIVGDVQSQVVAGVSYTIKLKIKEAECTENCQHETCEMKIWEKPWENFRELTNVDCKKKAVTTGGKRKISTSNKDARKALHFAVLRMNKESNDLFYSRPVSVNQIYKQVVNGIKYTIVFNYGQTECKKNTHEKLLSNSELNECPAADSSQNLMCKVAVVDKPWLKDSTEHSRYEVLSHECYEAEN